MMGRLERDQGQLFYSFCLEEVVPDDHQVRAIASVLDLSWVYGELSPHYPALGRPSIDPVLMIRMLILGYAFGLRSERLLCREVTLSLSLSAQKRVAGPSCCKTEAGSGIVASSSWKSHFCGSDSVKEARYSAGERRAIAHASVPSIESSWWASGG